MNSTDSNVPENSLQPQMAMIAGPVGGFCLLLIFVGVISLVRLRRRRRKRSHVVPRLPSPIDAGPAENADHRTHNSTSNFVNERIQSIENQNDFQLNAVATPNSKSKNRPRNYENVSTGTGTGTSIGTSYGMGTGTSTGDRNSSKDSDSESDSPDYENNPDTIARVAAEAAERLEQRRKNPAAPSHALAKSQVIVSNHPVTPARQAQTLDAKINACPGAAKAKWGSQDGLGQNRCEHAPMVKKGYVNTVSASRSLEDLDKRNVPQPPSLISSFNKKKAAPGPVSSKPPKPHMGKGAGYVNQPRN